MKIYKLCGFLLVVAAMLLAGVPTVTRKVGAAGSSPYNPTPINLARCRDVPLNDRAAESHPGPDVPYLTAFV